MKTAAALLGKAIDDEKLLYGLVHCVRRAVAKNVAPPADLVAKLGLMTNAAVLLDIPDDRPLSTLIKYEAAWIVTNMASFNSDYCTELRNLGCVKKLISLIDTKRPDLAEQVHLDVTFYRLVCMGIGEHRGRQHCGAGRSSRGRHRV